MSENQNLHQSSTQPTHHVTVTTNDIVSASQGNAICQNCRRVFKSERGLKQHTRNCKMTTLPPLECNEINEKSNQTDADVSLERYLTDIYNEIVYWKRNLFELPKGSAGKEFIKEMINLINQWNTKSPNRQYCLSAMMVMPTLILQRTSSKCKSSEIKEHVKRRLDVWRNQGIDELLMECRSIQKRLTTSNVQSKNTDIAKKFANFMIHGKVNSAMRLLEENATGGVLDLTDETMQSLRNKHPDRQPINDVMMLHGPIFKVDKVIYDNINADLIKTCASKTKGSAGPSGLDAEEWRKMISSHMYGNISDDLCHAIALMTRELCSSEISDPESISSLLACRLIPLDKQPGVRPIGIGEVLRRIMGKAVMKVVKPDVLAAVGFNQLCAGQDAGSEIAIHAVREMFDNDDNVQGFIQIDASNAFNSINRTLLLHNIKIICPEMSNYITNCYCKPARIFITGGKEISS